MKFTVWQYTGLMLTILVTTAAKAEMPDVSCVYQTSIQVVPEANGHSHHQQMQNSSKWYFWRTAKQVEVANEEQSFGEKWTNYNQKNVFYQAIYHDKKFLLDFQPADLKILGKQSSWELRTTLFPQSMLQQLQQKDSGRFQQYETIRYQGMIAGNSYQVDWIPELKLPLRVEKKTANKTIVTELKVVYPLDKSPYKQLVSNNYEDMDYADIGDNESHPIVAQLQKNIGIGYFHQH